MRCGTHERFTIRRAAMIALVIGVAAGGARLADAEDEDGGGAREEDLRVQVRVLSAALAAARLENDGLKARLDRKEYESAGGAVGELEPGGTRARGIEFRVLDVNRDLGMAVLSGGRRQGIRPGMTFAVMEGNRSVATLRVIDVRGTVAGAVVETSRRYPQAQDRAIRSTGLRD